MTALERVAAEAGGTLWLQFYMWPDRSLSHQLIARAREAGFEALVFTVDTPVAPGREYNLGTASRSRSGSPGTTSPTCSCIRAGCSACSAATCVTTGMPRYANFPARARRPRITALPMGRSTALQRLDYLGRRARAAQALARHADREGHTASARCGARRGCAAPTRSCCPITADACSMQRRRPIIRPAAGRRRGEEAHHRHRGQRLPPRQRCREGARPRRRRRDGRPRTAARHGERR